MAASGKIACVQDALLTKVEAVATAQGVRAAHMNVDFSPNPTEAWYIDARIFPNVPKGEGLDDTVMDQGLLALGAVFPRGVGSITALSAGEALKAAFPKGLELFSGGFKVKVVKAPYIGSPLSEDSRYVVPVTVEWVA